jgi:flagellar P-ring protein precursor FlgI
MGGYVAGDGANRKEVNSANVGMIPNGAIIERDTAVDLKGFKTVSLLLRNPDFATATQIAETVNREFKKHVAVALDSRRIDVSVADASEQSVPQLIARVQSLMLTVNTPAKIVINERTGTIVLGGSVKLLPVSVIHGSLSIQVVTSYEVVPGGMMPGQKTPTPATLVPETRLNVNEAPAQSMRLDEGANVEELVNGLHAIGTTARDVVAILQAIKAEGGIQAELEIQ